MSLVRAACWEQKITDAEAVEKKVAQLLSRTEIMVERKGKKGLKMINLRPFIYDLTIKGQEQKLIMLLAVGNIGSAKPEEVLSLLHLSPNNSLCQTEILLGVGEALQSPLAVCLREKEVSLNAKANYYQLRQ